MMDADSSLAMKSRSSSVAEDSSLAMERRSSSVAEDSPVRTRRNVCISYNISDRYDEGLVVLDLNSGKKIVKGSTYLVPRVKFVGDFFRRSTYCVSGNTIYVFGGYRYEGIAGPRNGREKSVYRYDLPMEGSGCKVEECMLERVCDMKSPKYHPKVISTPDGKKFVVHSSSTGDLDYCDFDVFDPFTKTCKELPTLDPTGYLELKVPFLCPIRSHTFMTDSKLLVNTDAGWYQLDIKASEPSWELLYDFPFYAPLRNNEFQLVGGNICLAIDCAYDIRIDRKYKHLASNWSFTYPEPTPLPEGMLKEVERHLLLVDIEGYDGCDIKDPNDSRCKSCTFCIIQFGCVRKKEEEYKGGGRYIPHLIVDVYECDVGLCKMKLDKYRKDKMHAFRKKRLQLETKQFMLPETCKIKSFMYHLDAQCYEDVYISDFTSVLPASISSVLAAQHLDSIV